MNKHILHVIAFLAVFGVGLFASPFVLSVPESVIDEATMVSLPKTKVLEMIEVINSQQGKLKVAAEIIQKQDAAYQKLAELYERYGITRGCI